MKGLKFPLQLNSLGRFSLAEGSDKIEQNLRRIISTHLKERWYEPNAGSVALRVLFRNPTAESIAQASTLIQEALNEQEPRAISTLRAEFDDFSVTFVVNYRIRETDERGLVEFKKEL